MLGRVSDFLKYAMHKLQIRGGIDTLSTGNTQKFCVNIKAKVDQLNTGFGSWEALSAYNICVSGVFTLAQLLLTAGSMFRFLWYLMLVFGKSQPLREHCPVE